MFSSGANPNPLSSTHHTTNLKKQIKQQNINGCFHTRRKKTTFSWKHLNLAAAIEFFVTFSKSVFKVLFIENMQLKICYKISPPKNNRSGELEPVIRISIPWILNIYLIFIFHQMKLLFYFKGGFFVIENYILNKNKG